MKKLIRIWRERKRGKTLSFWSFSNGHYVVMLELIVGDGGTQWWRNPMSEWMKLKSICIMVHSSTRQTITTMHANRITAPFQNDIKVLIFHFSVGFVAAAAVDPKMSQTDFGRLDPRHTEHSEWEIHGFDSATPIRYVEFTSIHRRRERAHLAYSHLPTRFLRKQQSVHSRRHHKTPTTKMESLWRRATQNC